MKLHRLALFVLLMGAVWAVSMPPVLVPYLEPGLNLSVSVLNTSLGPATVVSINGQETLIASNWNNRVVSDPATISSLFKDDVQRSSGFTDALAQLNATLTQLQTNQTAAMAVCGQYTGTDHLPCVSKDTCNAAAQASLAQNGIETDGFWEAMRDMVVQRGNVNISIQTLSSVAASAQASANASRALAADMADVNTQLNTLYTNQLFLNRTDPQCGGSNVSHCFEFCPKINWSVQTSGYGALQNRFNSIATRLDTVGAQDARAAALAKAQAGWLNFTQTKGASWTAMKSALQAKRTAIDAKLGGPDAKLWNDSALQSDYLDWKAQIGPVGKLADAGQFYAALQNGQALLTQADNLSARIDANTAALTSLQNNLKAIDKSMAALQGANANSTDLAGLNQANAQLKSSIQYPVSAAQLPSLVDQSSKLKQLVLAQVGQMTLGLPAQSGGNVSNQANQIVNANNNTPAPAAAVGNTSAPKTNASAGTSPASAGASALASAKAAGCPLPIGLALLGLMLGLGMARPKSD